MVYPPTLPAADRTDSTIAAGNHAQDHNVAALALADIVEVLGADPAGDHPDLTERLGAVAAPVEVQYAAVANLLASTHAPNGVGTTWTAYGFLYREAAPSASDHHVTTAGGVKLYALPQLGQISLAALGVTEATANITPYIVLAATIAKKVLVPRGTFTMTTRWDGNGTHLIAEEQGESWLEFLMDARTMDLVDCKLVGLSVTSPYTGPTSAADNSPTGHYVSFAREIRLGDNCRVLDHYHENAAGGLNVAGAHIRIQRYEAANIHHYKGWAAALHVAGSASYDVRGSGFKFVDCDRGCEVEAGARDVTFTDGYQLRTHPPGYTGQPGDYATYTFVLDAHSHDGESACMNITYRSWILEDCGGGVTFIRSSGTNGTDMPRVCLAEGIRILGNRMTTGYEIIAVQGVTNRVRSVELMLGAGITSNMRVRLWGGGSRGNRVEGLRADAYALPLVTIDDQADATIIDGVDPALPTTGTGWLYDIAGRYTEVRSGTAFNVTGTSGYVRFQATADYSKVRGFDYQIATAETFTDAILIDGAEHVQVDVEGSNFATVPPRDIRGAGAARYARLSGNIDRSAGESIRFESTTSRNRNCRGLILSTSSATVTDLGTDNDVSGIQRGNFKTEATGSNAAIANGSTTAVITHGVTGTPGVITVTPRGLELIAVTARTSTTFTVSRSGSVGALSFDWRASL